MEDTISVASGSFTKCMTVDLLLNIWVHILYMRDQIPENFDTLKQNIKVCELQTENGARISSQQRKRIAWFKSISEAKKVIEEFHEKLTISKAIFVIGSTSTSAREVYQLQFPLNFSIVPGNVGQQINRVSNSTIRELCGVWVNVSFICVFLLY